MSAQEVYVYPDGRMKAKDAARYMGFSERTLANWRSKGRGPQFIKPYHTVFYYKDELDRWLQRLGCCYSAAQAKLKVKQECIRPSIRTMQGGCDGNKVR